jgi:hypothetical protein
LLFLPLFSTTFMPTLPFDPLLNLGLPNPDQPGGNGIVTFGTSTTAGTDNTQVSTWETTPEKRAQSLRDAEPQLDQAWTSQELAALAAGRQATPGAPSPVDVTPGHPGVSSQGIASVETTYWPNANATAPRDLSVLTGSLASTVPLRTLPDESTYTYTGSNMRILLEVAQGSAGKGQLRPSTRKELLECTTLTVSIHREKAPVRACGYINPKGFARGRRTIGGTFILTPFTVDVLYRFLAAYNGKDLSRDSHYLKVDQLPPFDATLIFSDEYGHRSYRVLKGIDLLTDGTVYSVNDQITEQTITYMASDFTPLLPEGMSPSTLDYNTALQGAEAAKTIWDVLGGADQRSAGDKMATHGVVTATTPSITL